MTSKNIDRRVFVSTLCGLCVCARFDVFAGGEKIDPGKINFCGYTCPSDCKFLQGTYQDDLDLKKEAWELWKIEERYGEPFDASKAICYGCKDLDKPKGIVLARCTVRECAIDRKHDSCIQCDELTTCDKDLWTRFPTFHEKVVEMQKKYQQQV